MDHNNTPSPLPSALPQPPVMPPSDPRYTRPAIHPSAVEAQRIFRQACGSGDFPTVTRLIRSDTRDAEYLTEGLVGAIYQHQIQIAEYLLNVGAVINHYVPYAAADVKSIPIFELLLKHGWDINDPVNHGQTILGDVLKDESLTKWFLEHGARPNAGSTSSIFATHPGAACLNIAASASSIPVFNMLLDYGAERKGSLPLHNAAGSGPSGERIPMMAHLVSLGFDVNESDEGRRQHRIGTPLQWAIDVKSIEKVKFLMENGADPHKPVGRGGSPYKMAQVLALNEIVELFDRFSASSNEDRSLSQST